MIARLLIATLLTLTTLTSVAMVQPARDCRRHLLFFTDPVNCPPCRLFDRDYKSNPHFSAALNRDYRLHQPYTPQRDGDKFAQHSVTSMPTWLIVDDVGRELGRVSGYAGPKDFWERLIVATPTNSPKQLPPAAAPPATRPPPAGSVPNADLSGSQRLREANRALEAERDDLASRIRTLEQDLSAARARGGTAPTADCEERVSSLRAQLAAARSAHEKLQLQLRDETAALREQIRRASQTAANAQAETEKLQKRMQLPDAKPYQTPPKPAPEDWLDQAMQEAEQLTKPAAPKVPAAAPEPMSEAVSEPALQSAPAPQSLNWFGWLLKTGVAVAAPEIALPVAVATGIAAAAWKFRRKPTPEAAVVSLPTPLQPAAPQEPDFQLDALPFQDVDYTTTWAEHFQREGKSAELAAKEYTHWVNAFAAVRTGKLSLPGVEDGPAFATQISNWVHRQFKAYTTKRPDSSNSNHKAFFAFLHKQAYENIRNGKFGELAPNPKAADVLEDWVNQRLVGDLVFNERP